MKTLVNEEEVQSISPVIPQNAGAPQARIQGQIKVEVKSPVVAEAQVDCYESCLDLAALFLARG